MSGRKKPRKARDDMTSSPRGSVATNDDDSIDFGKQFSPIAVRPQKTCQQGNMTGIPRKVKDCCADWYNHTETWKVVVGHGATVITEIANVIQASTDQQTDDCNITSSDLREKLEPLCDRLDKVYLSLEKLVTKMRKITASLRGVSELTNQSAAEVKFKQPLFQSWPVEKFADTSTSLLAMYERELEVKQCISQNCAHSTSHAQSLLYLTAWIYDPYIPQRQHQFLIECLITETGLQ